MRLATDGDGYDRRFDAAYAAAIMMSNGRRYPDALWSATPALVRRAIRAALRIRGIPEASATTGGAP